MRITLYRYIGRVYIIIIGGMVTKRIRIGRLTRIIKLAWISPMTIQKEPEDIDTERPLTGKVKMILDAFKRPLLICTISLSFIVGIAADAQEVIEVPRSKACARLYTTQWNELNFDNQQINSIVRQLLNIQPYETTEIDHFIAKDINKDGQNEILAAINQECTGDPIQIIVFFRKDEKVYAQEMGAHWANIKRDVKDLNGDGKYEIIIRNVLAMSNCHADCVTWHTIYEWNKDKWSEASRKYPLYYKNFYIPNLEKRLAHLRAQDPEKLAKESKYGPEFWSRWKERAISDCYMGIDKAKRLLGEDPRAGFNRAVRWLKSHDRQLRKNAIKVFQEIGDDESIKYLEIARKDKNEFISQRAKRALEQLRQKKQ